MNGSDKFRLWSSWFALTFAIGLLYFRISLHSDSFFLEDLAADLFQYEGAWRDWKFTPAPAYVPDMLMYFIGYAILPSVELRIFFVTAFQSFLLVILSRWLARKIYPNISINAQLMIVLFVGFASLVASRSGMWLFFNTTNNHIPALLFSLLSLGLLLSFLERPKFNLAVLIVISGALAKISSAIFLICFTVPVLSACFFSLHLIHKKIKVCQYKSRLLVAIGIVVSSQLLATLLDKILTYHDPLAGRAPASVEAAGNSLMWFLKATQIVFSPDNYSTLFFSLSVTLSFIFLLYRLIQQVNIRSGNDLVNSDGLLISFPMIRSNECDWKFSASAFLLAIVVPINVFGAIMSGGFVDAAGYRYFMFPIALGMLLTIISIDKKKIGERVFCNKCIYLASLFLLIGCFKTLSKLDVLSMSGKSDEQIRKYRYPNFEDKIAFCIEGLKKEGNSLTAGVSDYWLSRGVSQSLSNRTPISPVTNDLNPFFWMSTIGPMIRPENYPKRHYDFAILRNPDHGSVFDFTPQTIGKLLPVNHSVHYCEGTDMQVWLYQDDKLDSIIKSAESLFLFREKLSDNLQMLGANFFGNTGKINGTTRIAKHELDKPGFLSYGPYVDLYQGQYEVVVGYSARGDSDALVGYIDMGRFNIAEPLVIYKANIINKSNQFVSVILDIPPSGLPHFEVRLWFSGDGELVINSLEIKKLKKE